MSDDTVTDAIKELNRARGIKAEIMALVGDDETALRDTLEGATDLDGIVRALILSIDEDRIMVDGITLRVRELQDRKARLEKRVETKRALIQQGLDIAERGTLELDVATVSIGKSAPKLRVTDEAAIPAGYWVPGDPTLDKKRLLSDLKTEGAVIPGADLYRDEQLTIKRV